MTGNDRTAPAIAAKAARLRVFGWQGFRPCPKHGHHESREIVAAPSKAAVFRIVGVPSERRLSCFAETNNPHEIARAKREPGRVLWRPLFGVQPDDVGAFQ